MAGKVQIAASGLLTEYLTANPEFSYFNVFFSKHSNFALDAISLKPDNEKKVKTGDHIEFSIPSNNGDILTRMSFSFSIPENLSEYTNTHDTSLVDQFAVSIFEYIELYLGEQLLDRVTSDDINIYHVTRESSTYALTNDCIQGGKFRPVAEVGNSVSATLERKFLTSQYWVNGQFKRTLERKYGGANNTNTVVFRNFIVNIPFYFHDRPKNGFPLCSIRHQELKIRVKLREGKEVVFPSISSNDLQSVEAEWDYENDSKTVNFPLPNFNLNMDVAYLDKHERKRMASNCVDILFEQNQHERFTMGHGIKSQMYRLNFKNCVKELYFIAKKKHKDLTSSEKNILSAIYNSNISSYGGPGLPHRPHPNWNNTFAGSKVFQKPVPCIYMRQKHVTLSLDGTPILDETIGSHQFLSTCIPNVYHKQAPIENNLTMYSFALRPDKIEPSGDINFTMIKDAIIQMTLSSDGSYGLYNIFNELLDTSPSLIVHIEKEILVIAKSYNILRIKDGVGKIMF